MGRRRRKGSADELKPLPWQTYAVIAVIAFIGLRWVIPGLLLQSPMLSGLRPIFALLSWCALGVYGFIALVSCVVPRHIREAMNERTFARAPEKSLNDPPSRQQSHQRQQRSKTQEFPETSPSQQSAPARWSVDALRTLEWKRFEILCARYYEAVGFKTETLDAGADGGIDVKLFKVDPSTPLAIVQCKAWNTTQVGVKEIRELLGVMAHVKVTRGIFVTTGTYTRDAVDFGAANPIQLLDGAAFEKKILELTPEKQDALLRFAFEGDYRTPTCASCGVKMVSRDGKRGTFWGCRHYPQCKTTLPRRG